MEISIKVSCGSAAEAEAVTRALNGVSVPVETTSEIAPQQKPVAADALPREEKEKQPTLEDVRAAMATLIKAKGAEVAQQILKRHKAEKVSAIKPADYAAVIEEAKNA